MPIKRPVQEEKAAGRESPRNARTRRKEPSRFVEIDSELLALLLKTRT